MSGVSAKTTLFKKKGSEKVAPQDKKAFEVAFESAIRAAGITTIDVKEMLVGMPMESLKDIDGMLLTKTPNDYKLLAIGEHTRECRDMRPIVDKMISTMDVLKTVVGTAIAEYFGVDDVIDMDTLRSMVKVIIKDRYLETFVVLSMLRLTFGQHCRTSNVNLNMF